MVRQLVCYCQLADQDPTGSLDILKLDDDEVHAHCGYADDCVHAAG